METEVQELNKVAVIGAGAVGCGAYQNSTHLAFLRDRLREEVVRVASAKGIDISDDKSAATTSAAIFPDARFSTLQDLDAKRETEIEMFSGVLMRLGKELQIETPYNAFAYHAIKALEEKNSGAIE